MGWKNSRKNCAYPIKYKEIERQRNKVNTAKLFHYVCILQNKVILLQETTNKNNNMKNIYASFEYFYFYFAWKCEAGSCV